MDVAGHSESDVAHTVQKQITDYGPNDSERRKKLRHFFRSNLFHYVLAVFIIIDLGIVLTDVILLLVYCDHIPHDVEEVFHDFIIVSITILGLFLIELSVQIYAFGPKQWLSNFLHVFDLSITLITFIMEISFYGNKKVESVAGLLIVFRLWRLVRVIHVTTEVLENEHELAEHHRENLDKKIRILQAENESLKDELQQLKSKQTDTDTPNQS